MKEKTRPFKDKKKLKDNLKKLSFMEEEIEMVVNYADLITAIKFDICKREGEIIVYECNQIYSCTTVRKFSLSQK